MKARAHAAILRLLPRLYQLRDVGELPIVLLESVSAVIPNVFATYNRIDLRTGAVTLAYFPPEWQQRHDAIMPQLHAHVEAHPIFRHVLDTGDGSARLISDFVGEEEWRETPFARAVAPLGVQESMVFCLQTSRQEMIFIALNRAARTFTEADREVAEILRPHFAAAYENAVAFTEVQALAALSAHAIAQSPHGIVLIDGKANVLHISALAGELLDRFFPRPGIWKALLPPEVLRWLERNALTPLHPAEPLQIERGGAMLTVRAAVTSGNSRILHLSEASAQPDARHLLSLGLTAREAEVLQWLGEGKSNPEIGEILGISHRTVAKHLQVIFEKLGVEGRIGAILRVKGL